MDNILSLLKWYQQIVWLRKKETDILALAHKLVHTFEKMDAINPTFELEMQRLFDKMMNLFWYNFNHFLGINPWVT
jgi:hypothetical protein